MSLLAAAGWLAVAACACCVAAAGLLTVHAAGWLVVYALLAGLALLLASAALNYAHYLRHRPRW